MIAVQFFCIFIILPSQCNILFVSKCFVVVRLKFSTVEPFIVLLSLKLAFKILDQIWLLLKKMYAKIIGAPY